MSLKVVVTGAGSGGHITPLLAVAAELKQLQPSIDISYIGQRGDALGDIPAADPNIDHSYAVRAGKFRRYHGEGLRQLLDLPTTFKNARDVIYVLLGIWQSRRLLRRIRPDIIFVKGGFVGVPVGLAAAQLGIPYITHDSDAIPGLANRIIARWARRHAVALPADIYRYPPDKTVTTGIPLQRDFKPVTADLQQRYRADLALPASAQLLFVIGGGLGAHRINQAVQEVIPHLLHDYPDLHVVHVVGRSHEVAIQNAYKAALTPRQHARLQVFGYLNDVYRYSGAADIIVTRAGATNLAEFALQGKACVIVPNPLLTGGHQLKNAQYLADCGAAVVIDEPDLVGDANRLAKQVSRLLDEPQLRKDLGTKLADFARPDASRVLAQLLLDQAQPDKSTSRSRR